MYAAPFVLRTPPSFYTSMDRLDAGAKELLVRELHRDLVRFLDPAVAEALEEKRYGELIEAVQSAFRAIAEVGFADFDNYTKRSSGR
jgi:hypothetical protein